MKERHVKKILNDLLAGDDFALLAQETDQIPASVLVTPLISFLYRVEHRLKWHAVSLLGRTMSRLVQEDMEDARLIMRRILWNLNEESGGIGWGMTEALGEIMAVNPALADEYGHMLVSYMREENYLELPALQRGLMWGLGRLAMARPEILLKYDADGYMSIYLEAEDKEVLALAARNFGFLGVRDAIPLIRDLAGEQFTFTLYDGGEFNTVSVGQLAEEALCSLQYKES